MNDLEDIFVLSKEDLKCVKRSLKFNIDYLHIFKNFFISLLGADFYVDTLLEYERMYEKICKAVENG